MYCDGNSCSADTDCASTTCFGGVCTACMDSSSGSWMTCD